MAIRSIVLRDIGGFKEWLSPGSLGGAYENTDIILRILLQQKMVLYNPHVKAFHDRWLPPLQAGLHEIQYIRGQMTCYSYFYFQGFKFAKNTIRIPFQRFTENLSSKFEQNTSNICVVFELKLLISAIQGIISGFIHAYKNPYLPHKR